MSAEAFAGSTHLQVFVPMLVDICSVSTRVSLGRVIFGMSGLLLGTTEGCTNCRALAGLRRPIFVHSDREASGQIVAETSWALR